VTVTVTDPTLVAELTQVVRAAAAVAPEALITAETRFEEDLGVDSFDLVAIFFGVEAKYGIHIPEADMPPLRGMAELAAYVATRTASAAA
jgi:acyl carrier protein